MKRLIFFIFLLSTLSAGAQDSIPSHFTLESCIELALRKNVDVRKSGFERANVKVNLQEARSALLPTVNGSADHAFRTGLALNPVTNTNERVDIQTGFQSVNAQLVLFNGLTRLRRIRQQVFAYQASEMDEQAAKDRTTMDVILAYLQVITAKDALEVYRQQLEVTNQALKRLEILQADGATPPSDYYDLKGQYSGEQVTVTNAENLLVSNKIDLVNLMNIPYSDSLDFAPVNPDARQAADSVSPSQLFQQASESLGMLKAAKLWNESARFLVKASRSAFFPMLSAGGSFSSSYVSTDSDRYFQQMQDNLGRSIGLTLSVPVLNGFLRRQNLNRAKINLMDAELNLETAENNLQQQTRRALVDLQTSREKYDELQRQVEAYKELFRIAQVRFDAGAINSVEFLQQKNKHDAANINFIISQYEWQFQQRIVRYYQGMR